PPRSSRPAPPPPQRAPRPRAGRESSLRGGDRHGAPAAAPQAPHAHSPLSARSAQTHPDRLGLETQPEPAAAAKAQIGRTSKTRASNQQAEGSLAKQKPRSCTLQCRGRAEERPQTARADRAEPLERRVRLSRAYSWERQERACASRARASSSCGRSASA